MLAPVTRKVRPDRSAEFAGMVTLYRTGRYIWQRARTGAVPDRPAGDGRGNRPRSPAAPAIRCAKPAFTRFAMPAIIARRMKW